MRIRWMTPSGTALLLSVAGAAGQTMTPPAANRGVPILANYYRHAAGTLVDGVLTLRLVAAPRQPPTTLGKPLLAPATRA